VIGQQWKTVLTSCAVAVALIFGASGVHAAGADARAAKILAESGVKGGLVVHLGCGDGELTAALLANERYLVHGLAVDAKSLETARATIRKRGRYGPVSVDVQRGQCLAYTDNLVNLVVCEAASSVPRAEIMRVLAPGGVLLMNAQSDPIARVTVKPRPDTIDEWTHYLHGADNNAVANDSVVGPPKHCQWISEPRWTRSHDHLNSLSALVSSGGRIFYIVDEAPTLSVALPPTWRLVARDAFNGVLLWKRDMGPWEGHLRGFRSGPTELARRLVSIGDRVYVTMGYGRPVSELDAVTGKTIRTYAGTENALELVIDEGTLFAIVGDRVPDNTDGKALPVKPKGVWMHWAIHRETPPRKTVVALEVDSGKELWRRETPELMPTALAVAGGRVYLQDSGEVVALEAASGKEVWKSERKVNLRRPSWSAPSLVVHKGVVLCGDRKVDIVHPGADAQGDPTQWIVNSHGGVAPMGEIVAFDAATGKELWRAPCKEVYNAPADVLVVDDLVWSGLLVQKREVGITQALDLLTGKVARQRTKDQDHFGIVMGHHRCYRNKATTEYLVLGRDGIEYIDVESGKGYGNAWVRGSCQYGVMPANGLTYAPSHSCACHVESKINSFNALAAGVSEGASAAGIRLEKGPAYGRVVDSSASRSWPTYRGDAARSGRAATDVPAELEIAWRVKPGGSLSSVVAADGVCVVAAMDRHTVHAFSMGDGKPLWEFTAGGRIDSPPTLHKGAALFGCADGWIYSASMADGRLAWRFRAAPRDRRIVAYGQVESAWPVHGSVLVQDGVLYAVAGRSSYLDGGLRMCRLNVSTGELLSEKTIAKGVLPDVPAFCDGSLYIRHRRFSPAGDDLPGNVRHLYSSAGFLDGSWWHRTYWQYGSSMRSNYGGWPISGSRTPAGRLMVMDDETVYGFGRFNQYSRIGSHVGLGGVAYRLYAAAKVTPAADQGKGKKGRRGPAANKVPARWSCDLPLLARGMVLANNVLFVAGPPDVFAPGPTNVGNPYVQGPLDALRKQAEALEGKHGGLLQAVSAVDGTRLSELKLDAGPVWDGMAAADGSLLLALSDGSLCCLRGK